jgi:hypothetical protein
MALPVAGGQPVVVAPMYERLGVESLETALAIVARNLV